MKIEGHPPWFSLLICLEKSGKVLKIELKSFVGRSFR